MWTMLLIAGTILRMAAGEGLPPEAEGCGTFREWWQKHHDRYDRQTGTIDPKVLALCLHYMERNPKDVVSTLQGLYCSEFKVRRKTFPQFEGDDVFAARLLGAMGFSGRAGVPLLKSMLQDSDLRMKVIAAKALWDVQNNPEAIAVLMRIVERMSAQELADGSLDWVPARWHPRDANISEPSSLTPFWQIPLPLVWGKSTYGFSCKIMEVPLDGLGWQPDNVVGSPFTNPYWDKPLPLVWGKPTNNGFSCQIMEAPLDGLGWQPENIVGFWALRPRPAVAREALLAAIKALGEIGPSAFRAAPLLKGLVQDKDKEIAHAASWALWNIAESPGAVEHFRSMGNHQMF